jgi:flagellar hook-length control protein FliK
VYSVTSDAASSVSFQTAPPPKPARADQSQGNDSFGALIDSNKAADTGSDRATSAAQQQSPSPRRADDAAPTADNKRSRDSASADRAAKNDSDDRKAARSQTSDPDANAKADSAQRSGAKSDASKVGAAKSTAKSSSDEGSASDSSVVAAASAQPGEASIAAPSPVAVLLAVTIPTTDVPPATPASGNATAPLAIAAAAIAASSSASSAAAVAASPEQIKIDQDPAAAVTTSAAATAPNASATAKIAVQAAASEAIANPVKQQAAQTDAIAATDVALTVAATAPVAPKTTLLKAPITAQPKIAASGDTATAPASSDTSAAAAPIEAAHNTMAPPTVPDKQEAADGLVDAPKADASAGSSLTTPPAVSAHDHSPVTTATAHTLIDSPDTGVQATGTIQPQLPSAAATPAPVGPLSVTPAANAAVPLSGLALEIAASARSGKSRFEIRLDPADLGRIDVRINVDRNGQVTSHLTVEKPETLSMLRQDAPQLQRALDDAGFKTGNGGLQFSLRDQSSSGQNGGNETGRNAHRLVIAEEETIPAPVAGRTYGRVLGSNSGVDIRV